MSIYAKIISLLLAVTLTACGLCLAVAAEDDEIDPTHLCNLSVVMRWKDEPVGGGDLTLFRVGELEASESSLRYVLTEQFHASGVSLEDLSEDNAASAKTLADYAEQRKIEGDTRDINDSGIVRFEGLAVGVYLVIQKNPADGYYAIRPFLIDLPAVIDGQYIYDAEAEPKVELDKGSMSDDSSESSADSSSDTSLPHMGQLNWPIPVLIIVGLVFIAFGLIIALGVRRRNSQ